MTRRIYTATIQLFDAVDQLFDAERGPNGEPSRHDFLVYDLLPALEDLAENYERFARPGPEPGTDVVIVAGTLVPFFAVYVSLGPDGIIEVFHLSIHQCPPLDEPA